MTGGPLLSRHVLSTTFRNPVLLAAGTAGYARELAGTVDLAALGGVISKAVSREPRRGNLPPRVTEFRGGMLNSVGLANPGLDAALAVDLPAMLAVCGETRVLVNVVGFVEEEYVRVVEGVSRMSGVAALELNLSCPNTASGGLEFGADLDAVRRIVAGCVQVARLPILAKLSPATPHLPALAVAAMEAGAAGVSLVNTMPGWIGGPRGAPRLGNGFGGVSGPALLPVGLAAVRRVRERLGPDGVIMGCGGVRSAGDVRAYLAAGADLVAIGTGALASPRLPEQIVRTLAREGLQEMGHG